MSSDFSSTVFPYYREWQILALGKILVVVLDFKLTQYALALITTFASKIYVRGDSGDYPLNTTKIKSSNW